MIFATQKCSAGVAGFRDLEEAEIEQVVEYWFGVADLDFLGIDVARMPSREFSRQRFGGYLRSGDKAQASMIYAITLDGVMVGYTNLNQYPGHIGYSHWHIIRKDVRAQGISTALYPHRIKMYFDTSNIETLVHQTRTRNVGVNRMLDKFVPVAETRHVDNPDGLALPGEFHLRYVTRADVPRLFERARELSMQRRGMSE